MGIKDLKKKYDLKEIIKGDSIFCATGITDGDLVKGINDRNNYQGSLQQNNNMEGGSNSLSSISSTNSEVYDLPLTIKLSIDAAQCTFAIATTGDPA